ncbi:hypothetical protein [Neisseria lactamica]|uniref:Holin n=1 Tax=Neisseria lactamica TaxID=486 RepID=A0AAU8VG47_NEILA|nr:hypothetical protein [Neisseria lactamica]ARB04802.1 hypothetical protein B2G52_07820 [Neisseria lactamica]CBX21300.1 unnamed protein product [Neisseria lactamica Y92-1009]
MTPLETSDASGHVLNMGIIGLSGTLAGMPLEALVLGAVAGALHHGLKEPGSRKNGILVIITSMLLAGSLSPMITAYLTLNLGLEQEVFKAAVPISIGLGWSWATPLLNDGLRRLWAGWIDKWGGRER